MLTKAFSTVVLDSCESIQKCKLAGDESYAEQELNKLSDVSEVGTEGVFRRSTARRGSLSKLSRVQLSYCNEFKYG